VDSIGGVETMTGKPGEAQLRIKTRRRLNAAQTARARMLFADGRSVEDIAYTLCVASECVRAAVEKPPAKRRIVWTDDIWAKARTMHAAGADYQVIAKAISMTTNQVAFRFSNERQLERQRAALALRPESDALAARDRRAAAMDRRTITATFFGDPPPGYSALDRKRMGVSP
jgi:hypothetical protein